MDSSQESFVVVSPHHPAHLPAHFSRFFPSLNDSTLPPSLQDLAQRVEQQRTRQPDHKLFIDHLVALALPDLDDAHRPSYPHDVASLVARLAAAGPSPVARSSLYYLALALSGPDLARDLAHDLVLPVPFRLATRALFLVDQGQYALALRRLADPRVQADFVPRTLAVFASAPPDPKDRSHLVLGYWRLARIRLDDYSSDECKHVLRALCAPERARGVHEAWQLARTWPVEAERDQLAATILETCFGANHAGLPLSACLSDLMVVPFTAAEDALATRFCAAPPSPLSLTLTVDWRLSKLVAEARPVDALRFYSRVRRDQGDKLAKSDARDRLLKAVEANLSDVQRSTLELDLSPPTASATSSTAAAAAAPARQQVTQPAWAPSAAPSAPQQQQQQQPAPSTPVAPPRTLAAARAAQRPAPPPAAPTADELPLSASPFVRSTATTGGAQGGLLRALEHAHTGMATPRKLGPSAASAAPGSPFVQAVTPARTSALVAAEQQAQQQAQPSPRPTLAGFGSVRQVPLTTSALASPAPSRVAQSRAPARVAAAAEQKEDEDDEMRSPTAQDDDAAPRGSRDRAVERTKAVGGSGSAASPARRAAGVAGKGSEPTKRRAVARRPPHDGEVDAKRSSARTVVKQQQQQQQASKAAKPPGAFPSSSTASAGEEDTQGEEDDEPAPAPSRRKQTAAVAQTPRRRSARASVAASSRAGTAEPASPPAAPAATAPTTTGRRATRAMSATPSESERAAQQTPVRRSSRLSGLGASAGGGSGTARRPTRGAARGKGRIEEESDE
ncbi:hypothetical protein JCM8208_005649 [Rhodotorula glutinis]